MRNRIRTLLAASAVLALTAGSGAAIAATHGKSATHKTHAATHKNSSTSSKSRSAAPKSRSAHANCPNMGSSGSSSSSSSYRPGSSA